MLVVMKSSTRFRQNVLLLLEVTRCTFTYLVQYIMPAVFSRNIAPAISDLVDVRFLDRQLLIIPHNE